MGDIGAWIMSLPDDPNREPLAPAPASMAEATTPEELEAFMLSDTFLRSRSAPAAGRQEPCVTSRPTASRLSASGSAAEEAWPGCSESSKQVSTGSW